VAQKMCEVCREREVMGEWRAIPLCDECLWKLNGSRAICAACGSRARDWDGKLDGGDHLCSRCWWNRHAVEKYEMVLAAMLAGMDEALKEPIRLAASRVGARRAAILLEAAYSRLSEEPTQTLEDWCQWRLSQSRSTSDGYTQT